MRETNSTNKPSADGNIPSNIGRPMMGGGRPGGFGNRGVPVVKPKNLKGTLKRLWSYFGKERKLLFIVVLLILLSSSIALVVPKLIGSSIDVIASKNKGNFDFGLLQIIIIALLAGYLIDTSISFIQGWIVAGVSQRIVKRLRKHLFSKLQKLPVAYFDLNSHGDIMSRLTNDVDNVSSTISQSTTSLMSGAIMILGSLVMMLRLSPVLTLASVITIPMVFILTKTITKKTKVIFKNQQIELGRLNGHIEETISGIHVVKAFNHEEKSVEDFENINMRLREIGIKALIWSGYMMPIMNVINNIGFTAVAGVGGILAINDMISIGVIASFIGYSKQFTRPLNELANIYNTLQSAIAGAERVFEVMDENEEASDIKDAKVLSDTKGNVVFKNVSFGYREDVKVLKDVSFEAAAGSTTALVGPTGAGKTTIVNLLTRFYDVTSGTIFIDDNDIRGYSRDSLRKCFGIVLQDTYLFSGTIKDNIRYGRLEATDIEIESAAKMANADTFIKRLPKGYNTLLMESGSNLSQGQRQLLAISRAILADPAILILDEATSSVDTRTEFHIQEALLKLMKGRTSFIIAHRLNTIKNADRIMVIDKGQIVEQGDHEALMKQEGVYYNMYYNQFKNIITE